MIHCKRYALFASSDMYGSGGMQDFVGFFDSSEEAVATWPYSDVNQWYWAHVADLLTGKVIFSREGLTGWQVVA